MTGLDRGMTGLNRDVTGAAGRDPGAARPSVADLRRIDLFDELGDAELETWAGAATLRDVAAGAVIAEQEETVTGLILLLEGTIETLVGDGTSDEPIGDHVAPTWLGAVPTLMQVASGVRMIAKTDVRVAMIDPEDYIDLLLAHRPLFLRVMSIVRPVVRRVTAVENNRERLASLGTMAAGLAHELNNPAAAAKRAAADLADTLQVLSSTVAVLVESGVEREQAAELVALQREALAAGATRTPLSALDAADAEDAISEALSQAGVADAWRIAEPLAAAGLDGDFVTRVAGAAGPATAATMRWIAASLAARELAGELGES
ncbi:MAG: cyclic nucleotide-binding domain-containing protein, partial [Solirubrobacteraceae bacterium]